jgi:hypothetical protein
MPLFDKTTLNLLKNQMMDESLEVFKDGFDEHVDMDEITGSDHNHFDENEQAWIKNAWKEAAEAGWKACLTALDTLFEFDINELTLKHEVMEQVALNLSAIQEELQEADEAAGN